MVDSVFLTGESKYEQWVYGRYLGEMHIVEPITRYRWQWECFLQKDECVEIRLLTLNIIVVSCKRSKWIATLNYHLTSIRQTDLLKWVQRMAMKMIRDWSTSPMRAG